MGLRFRVVIIVAMLVCLSSVSLAAERGLAVYYDPPYNKQHACANTPVNGVMVAGVSNTLWKEGRACGKHYRLRCSGPANKSPRSCKPGAGWITVKVVDYCREPCDGIVNLSRDAFQRIADLEAGKVETEYQEA